MEVNSALDKPSYLQLDEENEYGADPLTEREPLGCEGSSVKGTGTLLSECSSSLPVRVRYHTSEVISDGCFF
jgi:hypothetical protein